MTEIRCTKCGIALEKNGEQYVCPGCGARYEERRAEVDAAALAKLLDGQKQEAVANLRQQLWRAVHEEYPDGAEISRLAKEIKRYLPDDYFANFCESACGRDQKKLNKFLNKTDVRAQKMYVWDVLDFMLHVLREENLLAVNDFLSRAWEAEGDSAKYAQYNRLLAQEAERVSYGVYDASLPRDVFVAYSSTDMEEVSELVGALEGAGLKCFVAARNLQHGMVQQYEEKLCTAMDRCTAVVFVSSEHSRRVTCDALRVELPYIRGRDIAGAPAEYRNFYGRMPARYKKPRVEYVIDPYSGKNGAEEIVNEFFAGYERCSDMAEVVRRVLEYKTALPAAGRVKYCAACGAENPVRAKFCSECGGRTFAATREEYEEAVRRAKEGERLAAEKQKAEQDRQRAEQEAAALKAERERLAAEKQKAEQERQKAEQEAAALKAELERLRREAAQAQATPAPENAESLYKEGHRYFKAKEYDKAIPLLRAAAELGHAAAQSDLGVCYEFGIGVAQDYAKAVRWYLLAAPQGDVNAEYRLGVCCEYGTGVKKDIAEAVKWYRKAAEQNDKFAQYDLGRCCEKGTGVTQDYAEAVKWYRKAAEQGHKEAQDALARLTEKKVPAEKPAPAAPAARTNAPSSGTFVAFDMGEEEDEEEPEEFEIEEGVLIRYNGMGGDIVIPGGVTKIGDGAFDECDFITSIFIPKSVTEIDQGTFAGCCDLERIAVEEGNPSYYSAGNCVIEKASKILIAGCTNSTIPTDGSIARIGDYAFFGYLNLGSISIPQGVTCIGDHAFEGSDLTSITIPRGVTSIGESAFEECSDLTDIVIPQGVTDVGMRAFSGCESLTSVIIPQGVAHIRYRMFSYCRSLKSIVIPQGVMTIRKEAFYGCSNLTSVTIPAGVQEIEETAFEGCDKVKLYCQGEKPSAWPKGWDESLKGKIVWMSPAPAQKPASAASQTVSSLKVAAEQGDANAQFNLGNFYYNGKGVKQDYSEAVTWYRKAAEQGHINAQYNLGLCYENGRGVRQDYAEAVKWYRKSAEQGNAQAQNNLGVCYKKGRGVRQDVAEAVRWYRKAAEQGNSDAQFNFGLSCANGEGIGQDYAEAIKWFKRAADQKDADAEYSLGVCYIFGNGVAKDYSEALKWFRKSAEQGNKFAQYNLGACYEYSKGVKQDIAEAVKWYRKAAEQGHKEAQDALARLTVKSPAQKPAPAVKPVSSPADDFEIKNGVLVKYRGKGGDVVIPEGVTSIGDWAFRGCSSLTSVVLPQGVTSIGGWAFEGCSSLTSIVIPEGVTSIRYDAFKGCSSLMSVVIPDSMTSISYAAFKGCSGLTRIVIPNSVTSIGDNAFEGCSRLTSVVIPNSVTSIGDRAFWRCSGLTSVVIPNSVTSIGDSAFDSCSRLTSVVIPDSVTSIGDNAFSFCGGLTSIAVEKRNSVYHSAGNCLIETESKTLIAGCKNSVIPADGSVTSIGYEAFSFRGLTGFVIPKSIKVIEARAFVGCSGLSSIAVEKGNPVYHSAGNCLIETASKTLIAGCKNSVIPADGSVTSIGGWAFSGCSGLTSITIPGSVTNIRWGAFFDCRNLKSIVMQNGVINIDYEVFQNCENLERVIIPDGVTRIGNLAFSGCEKLASIIIPNSVTSIGPGAFSNCKSLTSIILPEGLMAIGWSLFENCSNLVSVTIPKAVGFIGDTSFANCDKVKLYCPRKKPLFWPKGWDKSLKGRVVWNSNGE